MGAIYGSSFYKTFESSSWTEAESKSVELGGHLITLNNLEEFKWARDNIWYNPEIKLRAYFTGLNDAISEGDYQWISGESHEWSDITDLIHRQNWLAQQHHASSHDYTVVHSNNQGFSGKNSGSRLYSSNYGNLIWIDDTSSFWGWDTTLWCRNTTLLFLYSRRIFPRRKRWRHPVTHWRNNDSSSTKSQVQRWHATTSDNDYTAINTTVSFAAGETSKTISVSTTADLDLEDDETFDLTITAEGTDDVPPQISDGTYSHHRADDFKRR